MFRKSVTTLLAAAGLSLFCLAPVVRADDAKVENPEFKAWAKFKPDTTVTREMKVEMSGSTQTVTMTSKLVSVDDDKAVVSTTVNAMGRTMPGKDQEIKKDGEDKTKGWGDSTGKEDIKIGDKTYSCKTYEFKGAPPGMPENQAKMMENSTTKIWTSDEVPGGIVKMTSGIKRGEMTMDLTLTTTGFEAK